jgi:parvulin-like peptidyl-prolyl isomerase
LEKRRRFARDYSELLLFSHQARQLGLDKDPDSQEFLQYKYSQALQVLVTNYLQSKANEVSDAEVEQYYKDHPQRFQEIGLARIFVPLRESQNSGADNEGPIEHTAADREAMQAVATKVQREAAAGGDFDKLEGEAYKAAHVTQEEPPETDLGDKWTVDNLPPEHRDLITRMQPGEVSGLIVHPFGWQIFKVTAKRMVPLNEAKPVFQSLRMRDAMQALKTSIDPQLNDAYFGEPAEVAHKPEGGAR